MRVVQLEEQALRYVVANLSDVSLRDVFATITDDYPLAELTELMVSNVGKLYGAYTLACDDGMPAGVVALSPRGGGRAGTIWIRTDRFADIGLSVHRWAHRFYIPEFFMQFRRIDFTGCLPDTQSGRWLRSLGFECEGIARAYSFRGEDFGHWAWVNPAWLSRGGGKVDSAEAGLSSLH